MLPNMYNGIRPDMSQPNLIMVGYGGMGVFQQPPAYTYYNRPTIMTTVDDSKLTKVSRQMFTAEEDNLLKYYVSIHGDNKWNIIAQLMGNRSVRQCRERYRNYLAPEINHKKWSPEEDKLLLEKYSEYGAKWSKISNFFASRTEISIKNRYAALTHQNIIKHEVIPENKKKVQEITKKEQEETHSADLPSTDSFWLAELEDSSTFSFLSEDFDSYSSSNEWGWD